MCGTWKPIGVKAGVIHVLYETLAKRGSISTRRIAFRNLSVTVVPDHPDVGWLSSKGLGVVITMTE